MRNREEGRDREERNTLSRPSYSRKERQKCQKGLFQKQHIKINRVLPFYNS